MNLNFFEENQLSSFLKLCHYIRLLLELLHLSTDGEKRYHKLHLDLEMGRKKRRVGWHLIAGWAEVVGGVQHTEEEGGVERNRWWVRTWPWHASAARTRVGRANERIGLPGKEACEWLHQKKEEGGGVRYGNTDGG